MPTRRSFPAEYIAVAARLLGVLSHEVRLQLVLFLAQGPATVSEACAALGLAQSTASHHLGILRATGLVVDRREGQFVVYALHVAVWRQAADGFFDHLLGGEDVVTLQNFRVERLRDPAVTPGAAPAAAPRAAPRPSAPTPR